MIVETVRELIDDIPFHKRRAGRLEKIIVLTLDERPAKY